MQAPLVNPANVKIETKAESVEMADVATGPAAASFIAAGVGSAALGLIIPLSEAIPPFKTWLTWNAGVGPLSGKTIIPSLLFFVVWGVLGYVMRGKNVNLRNALTVALVGMAIGLIGSFPPVFELFTR